MFRPFRFAPAIAVCFLIACNSSRQPAPKASAPAETAPPRITQFYATAPKLARGEKELLCYGVENTKTVWLSPPRQELSAALSRCVEVNPAATTTYTLTAEGAEPAATQDLTVTVGAARVHIIDVTVTSLTVKAGEPVNICVHAQNAVSIEIAPPHFRVSNKQEACVGDNPAKTTTYAVTATGADGGQDHEHVTVKVQ